MGRATEIITFINAEVIPSGLDFKHQYTYISKTEALKKLRKDYKKALKNLQSNENSY